MNETTFVEFENSVKKLCNEARSEYLRLRKLLVESKPDFGVPLNEEQAKQFSVLSKLAAMSLIGEYEQISTSQQRGLVTRYEMSYSNWGQPTDIKPSEQKSATIRLWSGMKEFTENVKEMSHSMTSL